jgi:uncharacterized repeat protein (TIGR01451 family)
MSRGKAWAGRRGIALGAIVVTMLAAGQAGTLIARADAPVDPAGPPPTDGVTPVIPEPEPSIDVPVPDVTIAEANDPSGAVLEGGSITYTLTVTNEGGGEAAAVQLRDQLPAGVTLADATAGCDEAAGLVTCALGEIGAHASLEADITVTVNRAFCGAIVNSADVSASNEDGEAAGNNASNEVSNHVACDEPAPSDPQPSAGPDLQVSKGSDAGGILHEGDDVLYTITVTNAGNEVATGVELLDVLPPGAVNVAVPPFPTLAGRACAVTSSVPPGGGVPSAEVRCGPLSLGPDASSSVTVKVIVGGDVCGPVTNVVDVEGANEPTENVGPDNHAETTDEIACVPRIRLLQGGPSLAHVGDRIRHAFTARNIGNLDLSDVDIIDPGCDTTPVLLDDGDGDDVLSVDERWRFACDQTITADDGDPVRNHATVSGGHEGGGSVTDGDTHEVDVLHPRIDVEATANPTSGPAGTPVVYTYAVTNTGDANLFGVSVDDGLGHVGEIATLPAGKTVELVRQITLGPSPITNATTAEGSDVLGAVVRHTDVVTVTAVAGAGAAGGSGGGSPFTGSDTGALAGWTLVLASLGAVLLLLSRGRSESRMGPSRPSESTT